MSVQYSPEYRIRPQSGYLDRLINETGGTLIDTPEDVYRGKMKDIFGVVNLTPVLLITALILFMLDIALRRLNLPLAALEEKLSVLKIKPKHHSKKPIKAKGPVYMADDTIKLWPETEEKPDKKEKTEEKGKVVSDNLDTSALLKKKKSRV